MKHRILEHIAALFVPTVCFLIFALPAGAQTPEYPGLINWAKAQSKEYLPAYAWDEAYDEAGGYERTWAIKNAESMWYGVAVVREYLEDELADNYSYQLEQEGKEATPAEIAKKAAEDAEAVIQKCIEAGTDGNCYVADIPAGAAAAVEVAAGENGTKLIYLDQAQYEELSNLTYTTSSGKTYTNEAYRHIVVKDNGDLWLDDELGGTLWMAKATASAASAPADSPDSTGTALLVVGGTVAVGAAATAVYFLTHAAAYQRVVTAVQTAWSGLAGGAQGNAALATETPAA